MPAAARIGDFHECKKTNEGSNTPHLGGPIFMWPGPLRTVIIGGQVAAVKDDPCTCAGPPDSIDEGSGTVTICGKPAARVGDKTQHKGKIMKGCGSVIIGG